VQCQKSLVIKYLATDSSEDEIYQRIFTLPCFATRMNQIYFKNTKPKKDTVAITVKCYKNENLMPIYFTSLLVTKCSSVL
jgi:hypothetical protein